MASPFNVPDEFVRGFFKSGQNLLHALSGTGGASLPDSVAPSDSCPPSLAKVQAHYWEQQNGAVDGDAS